MSVRHATRAALMPAFVNVTRPRSAEGVFNHRTYVQRLLLPPHTTPGFVPYVVKGPKRST